ncbi:NFYB8 [Hepatospora eriocheir]|uniref:NFYB8 n=1 Tax=Hepatospora eriocheir TaxID=1081669 RepID=A0A1X0Q8C7_9MICR|nr:NFYB8 [Hepatospora eriocheir]ORE00152.1 NFYB8 [Hepatospora eriocheir]
MLPEKNVEKCLFNDFIIPNQSNVQLNNEDTTQIIFSKSGSNDKNFPKKEILNFNKEYAYNENEKSKLQEKLFFGEENPLSFKLHFKDRYLPLANISKIMKDGVPDGSAKISKGAKEVVQGYASEFINIISCRSKEIMKTNHKKTVIADDLIEAMQDLDLTDYSEITGIYLERYNKLLKLPTQNSFNSARYFGKNPNSNHSPFFE